jgi:multidrug efflux pump
MRSMPELENVSSDLELNGKQLKMTIDQATAARFGITPASIDNALYDAFGQRIASTYFTQTNQYRVILSADMSNLSADMSNLDNVRHTLDGIYLPSATTTTGQFHSLPLSRSPRPPHRSRLSISGSFPSHRFLSIWRPEPRSAMRSMRSRTRKTTSGSPTRSRPPIRARSARSSGRYRTNSI